MKLLKEFERGVIFRLGRLLRVVGPGMVSSIPLIDRLVVINMDQVIPQWRLISVEEVDRMIKFLILHYPGIPTGMNLPAIREMMEEKKLTS